MQLFLKLILMLALFNVLVGLQAPRHAQVGDRHSERQEKLSEPHPYALEFERHGIGDEWKNKIEYIPLKPKEKVAVNSLVDNAVKILISKIEDSGEIKILQHKSYDYKAHKKGVTKIERDPKDWPESYAARIVSQMVHAIAKNPTIELTDLQWSKLDKALEFAAKKFLGWKVHIPGRAFGDSSLAARVGGFALMFYAWGKGEFPKRLTESKKYLVRVKKKVKHLLKRGWKKDTIPLYDGCMDRNKHYYHRTGFLNNAALMEAYLHDSQPLEKERIRKASKILELLLEASFGATEDYHVRRYYHASTLGSGIEEKGRTSSDRGENQGEKEIVKQFDQPIYWHEYIVPKKYVGMEYHEKLVKRTKDLDWTERVKGFDPLYAFPLFLNCVHYLGRAKEAQSISKSQRKLLDRATSRVWRLVASFHANFESVELKNARLYPGVWKPRQTLLTESVDSLIVAVYYGDIVGDFYADIAVRLRRTAFAKANWYNLIARDALDSVGKDGALGKVYPGLKCERARFLSNLRAVKFLRKQPISKEGEGDSKKPISGEAKPAEEGEKDGGEKPKAPPARSSGDKAKKPE